MKKLLYLCCFTAMLYSCKQQGDYKKFTRDPLLYCKTVKKLNDVVLYNNFAPVVASRNYAYANIAAYECVAAGDSSYQSLARADTAPAANAKTSSRQTRLILN
jgi:hypothetical protein